MDKRSPEDIRKSIKSLVEEAESVSIDNEDTVEAEKESFVTVSNAAEEKVVALEATVAELTEKLNEAEAMMHGMKEKEKKVKRVASLVEAGMDSEDAVAQVDTFDNLSDEQFEVFAGMHDDMKKKKKDDAEAGMHDDMKKKKKDDDAEANMHYGMKKKKDDAKAEELEAEIVEASEKVLDTAEVSEEDITLSLASEDIEEEAVASLRSNLQDWVNKKVLMQ